MPPNCRGAVDHAPFTSAVLGEVAVAKEKLDRKVFGGGVWTVGVACVSQDTCVYDLGMTCIYRYSPGVQSAYLGRYGGYGRDIQTRKALVLH
jgi:hypothetical protein